MLVRPEHVDRLDRALRAHGWRLYSTFDYGSPFGHAQTYLHDAWGYMDLHRFFPGIHLAPGPAFDRLWADRCAVELAGVGCPVPSRPAQALLLILNAARSGAAGANDVAMSGRMRRPERRTEIERLVAELDAHVAFAAATGGLDRFRGERDYRLWKVVSEGGSRSAEWWARVRAAPTLAAALRVAAPRAARERRPPRASAGPLPDHPRSSSSSSRARHAPSARPGARCGRRGAAR